MKAKQPRRTMLKENRLETPISEFIATHGLPDRSTFFRAAAIVLLTNPELLTADVLEQAAGNPVGNQSLTSAKAREMVRKRFEQK